MSVVNPKVDEHKGSLNILSDQVASRDDSISEEDKKMKNMELIKKSVERHKKLLLKLAK